MLKPGCVIDGKYKIIKEIGKGGMSTVYLSLNERLNQKWALKEIDKSCCENYEIVRQGLLTEIEVLRQLDHPSLPRIVDVIQFGNSLLIIMDYIDGKNLKDIITERKIIDESLVMGWGRQIIDVLSYLHSRNPPIIYRDLKPSNLMLKSDGRIMLIDFGTAREYQKNDSQSDTICLGTRGYAAPEQYGGGRQSDERTDIYCYGVTIYHLLTGKSPEKPPYKIYPIRYWNMDFSKGLEKIILKCTKQNPEERYQSCTELSYAWEHVKEENEEYHEKEKKKIYMFLLLMAGILGCSCCTFFFHFGASHYRTKGARIYVRQAERAVVEKKVLINYRKALNLQPAETMIYQSIRNHFIHPNDFTINDAADMMNLLEYTNKDMPSLEVFRTQNKQNYCEFCYEVGIGYFYHMGGITGKKEAQVWFQEVVDNISGSFAKDKQKRALLYRDICNYYNTFIEKGKDQSGEIEKQGYEDFYKSLHALNQIILSENSSPEEAASAYLISKEIAIEIGNYTWEFLSEKKINYETLKKELDKIMCGTAGKESRIDLLKLFKSKEEIEQLEDLVQDAKKKLLLVQSLLKEEKAGNAD